MKSVIQMIALDSVWAICAQVKGNARVGRPDVIAAGSAELGVNVAGMSTKRAVMVLSR
jgi:hypothetical protein